MNHWLQAVSFCKKTGFSLKPTFHGRLLAIRPKTFAPALQRAKVGADGGGRTHTPFRIPDFESSASANSATSATSICNCLLYTSDAADDLLCVDLGGRRII